MELIGAIVPSVINGGLQAFQNEQNYSRYNDAQERANQFAREERERAQEWNSLPSQFAQMARVGMNPNLLTGQAFQATSPIPNQSVSPPQGVAPQVPSDSLASYKLADSQSKNLKAQTITEDLFRDMRYKLGQSEIVLNYTTNDEKKAGIRMTDAQILNLGRSFQNLLLEADEIVSRTKSNLANVGKTLAETTNIDKSNRWMDRLNTATWNKMVSECAVNSANVGLINANRNQIISFTRGLDMDNGIKASTYNDTISLFRSNTEGGRIGVEILRTQDKQIKFQFNQMRKYDDWRQSIGIALDASNLIGNLQRINPANQMYERSLNFLSGNGVSDLGSLSPRNKPSVGNSAFSSGGFGSPSYSWRYSE